MEKENGIKGHKMMSDDFMSQKMNWKKIWLLFVKKVWMVFVLTILAAVLAAGVYRVWRAVTSEGQRYVVSSDYYITFNEDVENGVDHFNAYTWDTILRDDPLVEKAIELLPEDYTEDEIRASVTGEMLGDYRILTVYAIHAKPERAEAIARAYTEGLAAFADKLEMLDTIEMWSQEECKPVVDPDLTTNAAGLGAVIGFVLALMLFTVLYVLDDSIYVESDFTGRFDVPFLGMLTRGDSTVCKQELQDNLSYLLKEKEGYYLVHASFGKEVPAEVAERLVVKDQVAERDFGIEGRLTLQGTDLETLRKSSGAILMIPWGSKNGSVIEKTIQFLNKQDCKIVGAVVYHAEVGFLRKYYKSKVD